MTTLDTRLDSSLPAPVLAEAARANHESEAEFAARLRRIEQLENFLDSRYRVLGFPVGWDGIMGLVPVVGDTVAGAMSAYLIYEAHRSGADNATKAKMIGNAALDYVIGLVPVVGWVGDFFHKANTKNVRLLKEHLTRQAAQRRNA